MIFVASDGRELIPIDAIIDTGAILSLFPKSVLSSYHNIVTEDHTLWGIVDTPECQVPAKLAKVTIRLQDVNNLKSQHLGVTAAFSADNSMPALIGMKDILSQFSSQTDPKIGIFKLNIV